MNSAFAFSSDRSRPAATAAARNNEGSQFWIYLVECVVGFMTTGSAVPVESGGDCLNNGRGISWGVNKHIIDRKRRFRWWKVIVLTRESLDCINVSIVHYGWGIRNSLFAISKFRGYYREQLEEISRDFVYPPFTYT